MKKIILLLISSSVLIFASFTILKTAGSHPGSTGAPGDQTCSAPGCHADAPINQDFGTVNTLLFSSPDSTYIPGNTYTLTLQVSKAAIQKFGFELVALMDSTDTNIGTLTPIEAGRTQKITYMVGANDQRFSMTHNTAGTMTSTPGAIQWRMKWTAPSTDAGTITFYYATNCTNNNGNENGDDIYLSSFQIKPYVEPNLVGLKEYSKNNDFSVYFDQDLKSLNINFSSDQAQKVEIAVFDINGKLIIKKETQITTGKQAQKILLPENSAKGTYIVKMALQQKAYSTRVVVD